MSMTRDEEVSRVNIFLHAENTRVFTSQDERHLPVTVVTGFLGAGKTTLLNHILSNKSNLRIAAAINDFASLNIDENLVKSKRHSSSEIVELTNGCVCCHLLGDLQEAVWKLLQSDQDLNTIHYLVVETSGVTDPLQIIRTLDARFGKCFRARLDSVVTVVDADQMLHSSAMSLASAVAQLERADIVILNKLDLLQTPQQQEIVEEQVKNINSDAVIFKTRYCKVPLSAIMDVTIPNGDSETGINAITHEKSDVPIYVSATGGALRRSSSSVSSSLPGQGFASTHLQQDEFVSTSESLDTCPLSLAKLQKFLCSTTTRRLARIKGVLWIRGIDEYRCVLHQSGRGRLGFELDGKWTGPPLSEIAFIGSTSVMDTEALSSEFRQCCWSENDEEIVANDSNYDGLKALRDSKEFVVVENTDSKSPPGGLQYFYLSGSAVYGYSEEEIALDLRIDTNAMNEDLADAVNASVDDPKAFLAYTKTLAGMVFLCYTGGEPANNSKVLFREASKVLASHFRNVHVCKCGA